MTPQEQRDKLAMISRLSGAECIGWWVYFTDFREPFPGEIAALMERARQTGVTLPERQP